MCDQEKYRPIGYENVLRECICHIFEDNELSNVTGWGKHGLAARLSQ